MLHYFTSNSHFHRQGIYVNTNKTEDEGTLTQITHSPPGPGANTPVSTAICCCALETVMHLPGGCTSPCPSHGPISLWQSLVIPTLLVKLRGALRFQKTPSSGSLPRETTTRKVLPPLSRHRKHTVKRRGTPEDPVLRDSEQQHEAAAPSEQESRGPGPFLLCEFLQFFIILIKDQKSFLIKLREVPFTCTLPPLYQFARSYHLSRLVTRPSILKKISLAMSLLFSIQ